MKKKLFYKTIYILSLCLLSASLAFSSSSITVNENYYEGINSFIDMLYKSELGIDELMGASLNGVLTGMPEYSCFEIYNNNESEATAGIGANLEKVRNGFVVVSVNPSSSAFKSGLVTGDVIHRVDKQSASAMSISSFKAYLAGKESVVLETIDSVSGIVTSFRIKTEPDYQKDVDYVILDNAGYIRLNSFSETTSDVVAGILGSIKALGFRDIILDLRNLTSMNIAEASAVAGLLSPGGTISRTKAGTYNVRKTEMYFDVRILVNELTAGAGEVIAAAIPSVVYGQPTAGAAYHIKKYPVFTEAAYLKYSKEAGSENIAAIISYLNARKIEIAENEISGYLNIVESGVYNSSGKLISKNNKINPDVVISDTSIGYMDYEPGEGIINIRRDYAEGSVNYDVFQAKKVLAALGIFSGDMTVVFGQDMTIAVNQYKKSVGFPQNGVLDKSTQAMLNTYSMKTAVLNDNCVKAAVSDINR